MCSIDVLLDNTYGLKPNHVQRLSASSHLSRAKSVSSTLANQTPANRRKNHQTRIVKQTIDSTKLKKFPLTEQTVQKVSGSPSFFAEAVR